MLKKKKVKHFSSLICPGISFMKCNLWNQCFILIRSDGAISVPAIAVIENREGIVLMCVSLIFIFLNEFSRYLVRLSFSSKNGFIVYDFPFYTAVEPKRYSLVVVDSPCRMVWIYLLFSLSLWDIFQIVAH